ncbi:FAD-dependent monooxygenase [Streptomyces sp. MC1]|uniref:NAD(P)/FAD-dependent oxidoreductase n=1 Tax=Streptomyces sp. MC1 TaxID=295105 RepID=UPI0018C9DE84|nr:FAD-dependent monooxygenase [Streptomyces sp. MC1]MBG7704882.1 FAD-dependent monooxygenase [Streptomyces sp. MC1]
MSRNAVVIGAGVAGILAAAALAPVVDQVVVLDRDALPDAPEHRKGVPQGRHAHLMMAGGLAAMDALVPRTDMRQHLLAAGAHEISLSRGMVALTPEGWFRRWRPQDHLMITSSRALLEWAARTAVLDDFTNIEIRQVQAVGLVGSAERVRGVRIATDDGESDLDADFVVDASGRGSRIVNWLGQLGISDIPERTLDSGLVNSTRIYRVPDGAKDWPLTLVQPNPFTGEPGRSGMIVPIEGDRWMVSLGGSRGGEPPKDPDEFVQYALALPHPIVGQIISAAEPLTPVFTSHSTSNARRYLEKAKTWPDGLVVLGDALATFNPLYGQGMSIAALGAKALADTVRKQWGAPGLSRRIQRQVAKSVDMAWTLAVSSDVLYPGVVGGEATAADRMAAKYTQRLTRAATGSYSAAAALWDVTSVLATPTRLMRPGVLLSALAGPLLPPLSGPPLTPAEHEILRSLTRDAERLSRSQ